MKYELSKNLLIIVLSVALMAIIAGLIIDYRSQNDVLDPMLLGADIPSIKSIDVELNNRKLYLNIHLTKYISCKEIVESLDIQPLIVKNKIYAPSCSNINKSFIRITYTETTEA